MSFARQAHLLAGEGHPQGVGQAVRREPPSAEPGSGGRRSAQGGSGAAAGRGAAEAVLHRHGPALQTGGTHRALQRVEASLTLAAPDSHG